MALLFQDFSFSKPATRNSTYDEVAPSEGSRSPSPFSSSNQRLPSPESYSLPSLHDNTSSTPISSRLLGSDRRRNSLARDYFETIRARRQCAVRQQCDPRRASAIRLYVENLLSEEAGGPELHPSSMGMDFPSPRRSAPPTSCYEETSHTSTEDENEEVEAMQGLSITDKPNGQRSGSSSSGSARKRHTSIQKSNKVVKTKSRVRY